MSSTGFLGWLLLRYPGLVAPPVSWPDLSPGVQAYCVHWMSWTPPPLGVLASSIPLCPALHAAPVSWLPPSSGVLTSSVLRCPSFLRPLVSWPPLSPGVLVFFVLMCPALLAPLVSLPPPTSGVLAPSVLRCPDLLPVSLFSSSFGVLGSLLLQYPCFLRTLVS